MGYQHRLFKVTCPKCRRTATYNCARLGNVPRTWKCECLWTHHLRPLPDWPDVPRLLHAGWDKNRLLRLYPVPPEESKQAWPLTFSVRSVTRRPRNSAAATTCAGSVGASSMKW